MFQTKTTNNNCHVINFQPAVPVHCRMWLKCLKQTDVLTHGGLDLTPKFMILRGARKLVWIDLCLSISFISEKKTKSINYF